MRAHGESPVLELWFIEPDEGAYRLTELDEAAASKKLTQHTRRSIGGVAPSMHAALSRTPCYVLRGRSPLGELKGITTSC